MSSSTTAASALQDAGLMGGANIVGTLRFERPAFVFGHRIKDCSVGAFAILNAAGSTSAYRTSFGRYAQIGESSIIGPPEHPMSWFSSHPFAFTRPQFMPNMYQLPDFARLAPDADAGRSWAETVPNDTRIGHEAYVGVGTFIKRGVTIGDGAVVGAKSVVTKDVPPYAIAVGSPARVVKLRFDEKLVERFLKLQWWRYDLAPYKTMVDFSQVEATLDFFEARVADGTLAPLRPDSYELCVTSTGSQLKRLDSPLFFA